MTTVLVVDDEAGTRAGIQESIPWADHGFRVTGAVGSAYDALELIETSVPDIVILDIRMPEMDGIELLKIIRKTYPSVRVILISGYDEFEYAQEAVSARAFCYLLKPIDDNELLSRATEAQAEIRRERNRLEEDNHLRAQYASWLPAMQNNFICRLIRESKPIADAALGEAAELQMSLDGNSFRVLLMQTDEIGGTQGSGTTTRGTGRRSYRDYAVLNKAEEMWPEHQPVYPFQCDTRSGLLVAGPGPEQDVVKKLDQLRTWANEVAGLTITVGVGPEVSSVTGLRDSYVGAERALEARLVAGRNMVLIADRYALSHSTHSATSVFEGVLNSLEADAVAAVRTGDRTRSARVTAQMVAELGKILGQCIEAKSRLLHQVVAFAIKTRLSLDLDVPESVFACAEVECLDDLSGLLGALFDNSMEAWAERQSVHNNRIVTRALEYLHRNLTKDISLTRVAEALKVHPNYLSSVFKAGVGRRFVDYAREIKVEEAKRLLKETPLKVYEVAAAVQYQDVNHFTRTFKKLVGCSPSEYRDLL